VVDHNGITFSTLGAWGSGVWSMSLTGATNLGASNYTVTNGGAGCLAHWQAGTWIVGGIA
jgi:hypothetical protein